MPERLVAAPDPGDRTSEHFGNCKAPQNKETKLCRPNCWLPGVLPPKGVRAHTVPCTGEKEDHKASALIRVHGRNRSHRLRIANKEVPIKLSEYN